MWETWFLASAASLGAAAYLLIKRRNFRYAPHEVVYETQAQPRASPPSPDTAPVNAEYSINPPPPSFFGEFSNAVQKEAGAPPDSAAAETGENAEKSDERAKFRNLRFFDG